jgi:hypothetical protein
MKRFALGITLILTFPLAALAEHHCPHCRPWGNTGGTLTGSDAGLALTGSYLTDALDHGGSDLGTVTITTGALLSGSLVSGGTFSDVGSSFSIYLKPGVLGGAFSGGGVIFNGVFTSPISWSSFGNGSYSFGGSLQGTWASGVGGTGGVTETYQGSFTNGMFTATSGGGLAMISPEPSTITLFAAGLIGIIGPIRKKFRTSRT